MTPSVKLTAYPDATVFFRVDHLGGLLMDLVFDGRPRERLDVTAGMDALAEYVSQKVAGEGGRPPSQATT